MMNQEVYDIIEKGDDRQLQDVLTRFIQQSSVSTDPEGNARIVQGLVDTVRLRGRGDCQPYCKLMYCVCVMN
jgi:hypothetical protein